MDNNIKRTIIIDNFENPYNKGLTNSSDFTKINANNESCIDEFNMEIKVEDNIIVDMHFDGEGCAISTSATSIMLKLLIGKTIDEALNIINEYENMIDEKEYNEKVLGEAIVYNDTYKQPSRKKCALLPYGAIKKYLLEIKKSKRVSSRAVIIKDNKVLLFFRKKLIDGVLNEYYSIPGGKIEVSESLEECAKRELKEEFSVDIDILGYLGKIEDEKNIQHFFHAKIINGTPILGGEELERNSFDNYYEIEEIDINDIDKINLRDKEIVKKAINKEYKSI